MIYITPDYYNEFHCIADQCTNTCCAGWEITIDGQSIKRYQKVKGPLGNRLHNSIDWNQHIFLQFDHKCIFLNDDKLSDLYTEAGQDSLCQTCKQYPRHIESYLNVRELSIAISCPEVARMLLTREDRVTFVTKEVKKEDEVDVAFSSELFHQLNDARQLMFDILGNRMLDMKLRMGLVLGLAHDLQKRVVRRDYDSMARLLQHYKKEHTQHYLIHKLNSDLLDMKEQTKCRLRKKNTTANAINNRRELIKSIWNVLHHLKALNQEWPRELTQAHQLLNPIPAEEYKELYAIFYEKNPSLAIQIEQLMVYFLYGYTNGAVYDGEFYSKVKFATFHTLAIEELFFASWIEDGFQLCLTRQVEIAHKYAREIEHLDENIEYIETMLRKKKEFMLSNWIKGLK